MTAGASFESRVFQNTFTTVEFDPLAGKIEVAFIEYNPQTSEYEYEARRNLDHRIDGPCNCTVEELAKAIDSYCEDAVTISGYLSSLLLGFSSDIPMAPNGAVVFGNWDSIEGVSDALFRSDAENFRGVGRAVRLLHGRKSLAEILAAHGRPIRAFVRRLKALSEQEPIVKGYLKMQKEVRARQRLTVNGDPLRHTVDLLMDLISTDDWDGAQSLAERTIDVSEAHQGSGWRGS